MTTSTTLINVFTVKPEATQDLVLNSLRENIETVIKTLDGWISTTLIASNDGERVVIQSQWKTAAAIEQMRTDPRMIAYFPDISALATIESTIGTSILVESA